MRFQVMRLSAAALAMSVLLVGAASAQAPKAGRASGSRSARSAGANRFRRNSIWCRRSRIWAKFAPKAQGRRLRHDARFLDLCRSAPRDLCQCCGAAGRGKAQAATSMHLQVPIGMLLRPGLPHHLRQGRAPRGQNTTCAGRTPARRRGSTPPKRSRRSKKAQTHDVVMARCPPRRAVGSRADVQYPVKDFGQRLRRQTDRSQGSGTATPGACSSSCKRRRKNSAKCWRSSKVRLRRRPAPPAPAAPAPAAPAK